MVVSKFFHKIKNFFLTENDSFWLLVLLGTSFLAASITIFGGDLGGRNISTPIFYSTFVFIYLWFICNSIKFIRKKDFSRYRVFLLLGVAFVIGLFNIVIQTPISGYSINYFKKIIITFTVLLLIYLCSFGKFNKILKYAIPIIGLILSFEIAISYFSGMGQIYANQTSRNLLYFTFGNSNAAGIYFAIIILLNACGIFFFKKIYIKLLFAAAICLTLFFLYKTHARNAIVALVLCLVFLFVFALNYKKSNTFYAISLIVACTFPILVITIYTTLATRTNVLDVLNLLLGSQGKTATSRIASWVSAFKHLSGIHFLLGDYYHSTSKAYELFNTIPGYQNSQIDFFVDMGFIPGLLILAFIFICAFHRLTRTNNMRISSLLPVVFWLFSIFSSIFEGGLFICMNVWYIFGFAFIALGSFSEEGILVKKDNLSYYDITI